MTQTEENTESIEAEFIKYLSQQQMAFKWEYCKESTIGSDSYKLRWDVKHVENKNEFKHIRDELNFFFSNETFLKIVLCVITQEIQFPIDGWDKEYKFNSHEPFVALINPSTFEHRYINLKYIESRKGFIIRYKKLARYSEFEN